MLIQQGFKYRLEPDAEQRARLRVLCGHARFVWNQALAECNRLRAAGERVPRYNPMSKWLTAWKRVPETAFLTEAYTDNLQQKLMDLDAAWQRYFGRINGAEPPRFKKKGRSRDNIRFVNFGKYCALEGRFVKLPAKLGWIKFRRSRKIQGRIKNCTVSFESGHWWISFLAERTVKDPVSPEAPSVGIDAGIARFATLSDGSHVEPRNSLTRTLSRLAKRQRALSRKRKGSNNWKKAKAKVTRLHTHIANCRRDFLHKTSTHISKNHAMVAIEDLDVRNMSASARGDAEHPGRNVRAKAGLNRSILDQGWYEFRRQLEYKLRWRGGQLVVVPPHYTSQTCPECGHVDAGNRPSQAVFCCLNCGHEGHADEIGAMNILARGMEKWRAEGQDTAGAPAGCLMAQPGSPVK